MERVRISSMVIGFLAAMAAAVTGCGGVSSETGAATEATGGGGDAGGGSAISAPPAAWQKPAAISAPPAAWQKPAAISAPPAAWQKPAGTGGDGSMGCIPGAMAECYDGPPGTEGVGACVSGLASCNPDGTQNACLAQVLPVEEDCSNAVDDDCDGEINQGCP